MKKDHTTGAIQDLFIFIATTKNGERVPMEQQETWNFFDLGLNMVCEQALVLIVEYVKFQLSYKFKKKHAARTKAKIKINRNRVAYTEKLSGKMHFCCSKYTNWDAFATRGQNRNLKFHHKPFQKLPLFFSLFSLLPYRTVFITEIDKSLTSVVGLERPLIISNWLCACTSIN
jgi:hypothetical protein